jgi:hypothetical protein
MWMELGLLGAAGLLPVIVVAAVFEAANLRRARESSACPERLGFLGWSAIPGLDAGASRAQHRPLEAAPSDHNHCRPVSGLLIPIFLIVS